MELVQTIQLTANEEIGLGVLVMELTYGTRSRNPTPGDSNLNKYTAVLCQIVGLKMDACVSNLVPHTL